MITEQMEERLEALFKGAYECDDKVEGLKEQMKDYNKSKSEFLKNVSKEFEMSLKSVKEAYKQWIWSNTEPHINEDVETILEVMRRRNSKLED